MSMDESVAKKKNDKTICYGFRIYASIVRPAPIHIIFICELSESSGRFRVYYTIGAAKAKRYHIERGIVKWRIVYGLQRWCVDEDNNIFHFMHTHKHTYIVDACFVVVWSSTSVCEIRKPTKRNEYEQN